MEFAQATKRARTSSGNMVRMTGLDQFNTTVEDIKDFFAPLRIRHVILLEDTVGGKSSGKTRFNGTANVFFDSRKSASIAMRRNLDYIGNHTFAMIIILTDLPR